MATPTAECVEALREAADRLGKSPTKAEYEALDLTPSSTTICRVVGGWNEAKELANLYAFGQNENGGRDVSPKPDGVVVPSGRDWEELTAQQRWYYKNRRHRIQTKESRRRELREWFTELKRDRFECGRCHEARPEALDFHHPDRKHEGVSQMVNHGYSKERIRGEMDRCTVLCANCHRREHYDGPDATRIPDLDVIETCIESPDQSRFSRPRYLWVLAYKRDSDGCQQCSTTDPVCLDFHHPNSKRDGVAKMVSWRRSIESIRREIDRCVLLCASCHRAEHRSKSTDDTETDKV